MPIGYHHYYAYSWTCFDRRKRSTDYFLGGFVGDHLEDEAFAEKLKRIESKLREKFGFPEYMCCWSPAVEKPYKPRSQEQRYKTAIVKATNKHRKRIQAIRQQNYLFGETFIAEEEERFLQRQEVLKNRYHPIQSSTPS
jgi:hypothetical protein